MEPELLKKAKERAEKLGYGSFSEYVQFLLEADVSDQTPHVTIRDESGSTASRGIPKEKPKS